MVAVQVCREPDNPVECGDGDTALKWGDDIFEPLATTDAAAVERGRVEIDLQHKNKKDVKLKLHSTAFVQPGTIMAIAEVDKVQVGMANKFTLKVSRTKDTIEVGANIVMERLV